MNSLKALARFALILFGLLLVAAPGRAQLGPPAHIGAFTDDARHVLDSLADLSRRTRTERAACLHSYWVENDTMTFVHFKAPAPYASDSIGLKAPTDLCPDRMPVLHTHVAVFTDSVKHTRGVNPEPSTDDMRSTTLRGVFGIILAVGDSGWRLVVYP